MNEEERILLLLTPPFDKTTHDPGYIQGYLPGVRENGAQYTHAALWTVLATALQGNGDRALELFQMINPITHSGASSRLSSLKYLPFHRMMSDFRPAAASRSPVGDQSTR